jgi:predicted phage-related endonuclease
MGAACGVSERRTPYQLWLSKTSGIDHEIDPALSTWGLLAEDRIIEFANIHLVGDGAKIAKSQDLVVSAEYPWVAATIDALRDGAPVEIKTTRNDWRERVPDDVIYQLQTQMLVVGSDIGYLLISQWGSPPTMQMYPADDEVREVIIERSKEMYRRIQDDDAPPVDHRDEDTIRKSIPVKEDKIVKLGRRELALSDEIESNKAKIKELERQVSQLQAEILVSIGDASVAVLPDGATAWRRSKVTVPAKTVGEYTFTKAQRVRWRE